MRKDPVTSCASAEELGDGIFTDAGPPWSASWYQPRLFFKRGPHLPQGGGVQVGLAVLGEWTPLPGQPQQKITLLRALAGCRGEQHPVLERLALGEGC